MKNKRWILFLLLSLFTACSGQATKPFPAINTQPALFSTLTTISIPSARNTNTATPTSIVTNTTTATLEPAATITSAPTSALGATVTSTPAPLPTDAQLPTQACPAIFIPTGFSLDGNHLVGLLTVDGMKGTRLQVLDLQTPTPKTLVKNDENISVAALSPDRETLAWALPDFQLQLIRLRDGHITATLTGHTQMVNALLFSPDGSRLYSASADHSIIVWDTQKKVQLTSFQPTFNADNFPSEVLGLGISPDGKTLVTIPLDGSARTWDTITFKQVSEYQGAISGGYNGSHARFSPDGKYMAIGLSGGPGDTALWQVADHKKLWSGGMLSGFDFSPDGRLFAHIDRDEINRYRIVIRSSDGQTVYRSIPPLSETIGWKIIFSPDSYSLVSMDGTKVRFWKVSDGSLQKTYIPPCP